MVNLRLQTGEHLWQVAVREKGSIGKNHGHPPPSQAVPQLRRRRSESPPAPPAQDGQIGGAEAAATFLPRREIAQIIRHDAGSRGSPEEGRDQVDQPHLPHGQGLQCIHIPNDDAGVDGDVEVVLFAGVEKDGVLYRTEKLIDIRLLDAQYPTGQAIEDRLFHLLGVVLFPASGQEDAREPFGSCARRPSSSIRF